MPITKAAIEDIPPLVSLINSAYRGEASTRGWTTEANIIKGELRTDEPTLKEHLVTGTILKYTSNEDIITGCVYLEKNDDKMYLGMLSVNPDTQSQGIGKQLLQASETFAKEVGCVVVYMTVISVRTELITWYNRHGYLFTGETEPFVRDEHFGKPIQELEFLVLEKQLV